MGGDVILELTSADIPAALAAITNSGIEMKNLRERSALSVRFSVRRQDMIALSELTEKRGESLRQVMRMGAYWKLRSWANHWVLITGILFLLMLTAWLPTRVLFIRVEGNRMISTRMVLEKAAQCGIIFGADRGAVRSERMKNALLDALPDLQWAGINTYGCLAVITVEERELPKSEGSLPPGSIVASRDAIILELTASRGTASVKPGDAVQEGDLLISGYADCGKVLLLQGAAGEVYGRTLRKVVAKTAEERFIRGECHDKKQNFSLIIGKNRINFYEDSGILDTGCVKMYSEYCMMLPGGFALPVKLIVETEYQASLTTQLWDPGELDSFLSDAAAGYLQSQMVAGSVLSAKGSQDGYRYTGEFVCREMIGRLVYEEIVTEYGEDR